MKKINLISFTTAALFACTNLFAQSTQTPWLLEGNSNVDQNIHYLGTSNSQDLRIRTSNTQRMVVSGTTGNIGIGVVTPSYPLHIASSLANRSLYIANTTTGATTRYATYSSATGTGSGNKYGGLFEAKNGTGTNYGIKTTGNGSGTNYGVNALAQGNNTNYGIYAKALGSEVGLGINYAVYGVVEANNSNAWAGYFSGRGYFSEKVGIGTTVTAGLLNVAGNTTTMAIATENNYAGASSSYGSYSEMNGAATGNKYGFYSVINNGSGNNYGVRVQVNDGSTAYGLVGLAAGSSNSYGVYGKATGTQNNIGVYGEGTGVNSFAGYFNGNGYFSERLGVGTSNPSASLHVNADAVTLPMAIQISGASKLKVNTNGSVSIGGVPSGPTNGLYVNGKVVIGTSTAATGYMVSVGGKVICEELKVKLEGGWPDYVFGDNYKVPTIAEMEHSIKQNKHLPGMPSAAEVESNEGFEVGEMQTKMMEKIEEQALYIIQLKNEMDELKSLIRSNK